MGFVSHEADEGDGRGRDRVGGTLEVVEGGSKLASALAYPKLLIDNRLYRAAFFASIFQDLGAWANLIASLKVIESLGDDKTGFNAALVFFCRQIPTVVLFPISGFCADRYDRKVIMLLSNCVSALVAAAFVVLTKYPSLGLLCLLILSKNAMGSFYDPCDRAVIPQIVHKDKIHVAMTLNGVAWSSMLAIGAALGGVMTSQLGLVRCFLLDAVGFVLSIGCLLFLPSLRPTDRYAGQTLGEDADEDPSAATSEMKRVDSKILKAEGEGKNLLGRTLSDTLTLFTDPSLRLSLLYCTMKATGGLIWGPADVLNLKFSETPGLQIAGDQPLTLGIAYASVGVGCFVGPMASNAFFGKKEVELLSSVVFAVGCLASGYVAWSFASTYYVVYLGNFLRSAASAIIWIKSTILIQLYSDPLFLGRLFALERAIYTLANSSSMFTAGLLLDGAVCTVKQISAVLLVLSAVMFVLWTLIKRRRGRRKGQQPSTQYEMVPLDEDEVGGD